MRTAAEAPISPLPWRAVQAGAGWMLQASDGSWVANFHSQADAEYVAKAVEVCRRLSEPGAEPQPASPLPWQDSCYRSWVLDAQGQWVAEFSEAEDLSYAVLAANAYPALKKRLDRALEACQLTVAANDAPNLHICLPLLKKAAKIAREALEEAERDG